MRAHACISLRDDFGVRVGWGWEICVSSTEPCSIHMEHDNKQAHTHTLHSVLQLVHFRRIIFEWNGIRNCVREVAKPVSCVICMLVNVGPGHNSGCVYGPMS